MEKQRFTKAARNSRAARRSHPRRSHRRGAVLIEAAAAVVFLLVLTMGIVQFGIFYNTTNALSQIAREGGRFAAVRGMTTSPPSEATDQFLRNYIKDVALKNSIVLADSDISISPDRAARVRYSQITVGVSYDLNKRAFMPNFLAGRIFSPGVATRTSVMMLE